MKKWTRFLYTPNLPLEKNEDGSFRRVTACKEHIELSRRAAREGMVLLKNNGPLLPLKEGTKVALLGKGTIDYVKGGGGSGDVTCAWTKNLYEGLKELPGAVDIFQETVQFYQDYVESEYAKGGMPGLIPEPALPSDLLEKAAAYTDTAILSISRYSGEGWDRSSSMGAPNKEPFYKWDKDFTDRNAQLFPRGDFYLTEQEEALVAQVTEKFAKIIVVMNVGGMVDTSWFAANDKISSVLMAWQGGMDGGLAAAELLTGKDVPSGKLADTFAARLEDYPSTEGFHASDDYVEYTDDIYVGYRYFETIPGAAEKVIYPFGYGLSYTEFTLGTPFVRTYEDYLLFTVSVTNTGTVPGREVVQLYYSAPQGKLGKPARVLASYRKTYVIEPGKKEDITLILHIPDMASYDDTGAVCKSAWVLEKGTYSFYIGTDVRSARKAGYSFTLPQDAVMEQLTSHLAPSLLTKRLRADGTYEDLPKTQLRDFDASAITPLDETEFEGTTPSVRARSHHHIVKEFMEGVQAPPQLIDVADGKITMKEFIATLSDEDLAYLVSGIPNTGCANTYGWGGQPEHGIPAVMTADGPAGLRILPEAGVETTAFPCSTLLACTWDPDIVGAVGAAGGSEVKENNIGIWLTPAVNIHRSPLCGRNFEYYSEDPLLAGRQAAAMVRGIQDNNIAATVKHFALNNKETNRKESDSRCSERAIREIYLKPFEIIVKEARPWSIMTSYNRINGCRASECKELLTDILRGEWGFEGAVTTDWWAHGEHYKECTAGNDIKMGCGYPERLLAAMEKDALTREDMEKAAENILNVILKLD